MPTPSAMIVSSGTISVPATTRGITSLRIGSVPERPERRNLLGDHHRAQFGGNPRAHPPGHHQRGQHGAEFLDHRGAHQPADDRARPELVERQAGLQREHHAGEQPRQHARRSAIRCRSRRAARRCRAGRWAGVTQATDHLAEQPHVFLDLQDRAPSPRRHERMHGCASPPAGTRSGFRSRRRRSRRPAARSNSRFAAASRISRSRPAMPPRVRPASGYCSRSSADGGHGDVVALVDAREHVVDVLDDRGRRDAVLEVVGLLHASAAVGLVHGAGAWSRSWCPHTGSPGRARCARPGRRLDERARRPQEALLVGVEHRHERDLGQVEALAQQVDAHEHVERAPSAGPAGSARARACRCPSGDSARARPAPGRYCARSSAMRLVSVVTSTRSPRPTTARISASRSSTCPWTGRTSIDGIDAARSAG